MELLPAIDLFDGKAVRLYKGDYSQMTIYSDNPVSVAKDFQRAGAKYIHLVDLEGAKNGNTPNLKTVKDIAKNTDLFIEIGENYGSARCNKKNYLLAGCHERIDKLFLISGKVYIGIA